MATVQKSIRLPEEAVKEIEALASVTGRDFSGVARDLLIDAVKMRRCPMVLFHCIAGDCLVISSRFGWLSLVTFLLSLIHHQKK